jgi:hypothetical protein
MVEKIDIPSRVDLFVGKLHEASEAQGCGTQRGTAIVAETEASENRDLSRDLD